MLSRMNVGPSFQGGISILKAGKTLVKDFPIEKTDAAIIERISNSILGKSEYPKEINNGESQIFSKLLKLITGVEIGEPKSNQKRVMSQLCHDFVRLSDTTIDGVEVNINLRA